MRTYDEAKTEAAEGSPFSNGTDGEMWMSRWCERCSNDPVDPEEQAENGCPLILIALEGYTPAEWLRQSQDSPDRFHCVEYRGRDDGNGDSDDGPPPPVEPRPIPDPPNQPALFPRERFEGVRMYADMVPVIQEARRG